jgi:S-formylglutathione hydrolase FrmB
MKFKSLRYVASLALALSLSATGLAQLLPVKTVAFDSPAVSRRMKFNIVLPAKYEKSTERYPVLYLLHGYSGNYTHWAFMGVPAYALTHDLIVVMPDAGNSWYVNWAHSEGDQKNQWEDAIIKDLIGHIDATYRTIARREGRAINGLSMGGYGSLMLGLRHPDLFCSVSSHSGALAFAKTIAERLHDHKEPQRPRREPSTKPDTIIGIPGFSSQAERSPKGKLFVTAEQAEAHDPFKLVLKVPRDQLPHLYIDCGTEDRLLESNRAFAKLLMEHKIPFVYAESAGGHTGAYWRREVALSMAVQETILRRSLTGSAVKPAAAAQR